jgi:hypothetical protein
VAEPLRLAVAADLHTDLAQFEVTSVLAGIVDALQDEDYVGVWALSAEENQLQPISSGQDRKQIAGRLKDVRPTVTSRELLVTIDVIMNHVNLTFVESGLGGSRVLVLITGGPNTSKTQLSDVIEVLKPTGVQVHTLSLGSTPPEEAKAMARATNGRIYLAEEPGQLKPAVSALMANLARIRQNQPVPETAADRIPQSLSAGKKDRASTVSKAVTDKNSNAGPDETDSSADSGLKDGDDIQPSDKRMAAGEADDSNKGGDGSEGNVPENATEVASNESKVPSDDAAKADELSSDPAESSPWVGWIVSTIGLLVFLGLGIMFWIRRRATPSQMVAYSAPTASSAEPNFERYFSGQSSGSERTTCESMDFEPLAEGERFSMTPETAIARIGRNEDNDIVLMHRGVSGTHAVLEWRDGQVFVVDKGSTNGTYVDDVRISEHCLESGQIVRFDSLAFRTSAVAVSAKSQSSSGDASHGDDRTMVLSPDDPMLQELIPETEEDDGDKTSMLDVDEVSMIYHQHCLRHTNRIAQTVCNVCTRPYCSECLVEVKGELVCSKCRAAGYG